MTSERIPTPQDAQLANDRLRGNGSWNGNGLLVFLALTGRKDRQRRWMEPLRDLCERVVAAAEDRETLQLTSAEAAQLDELAEFDATFQAALAPDLK